MWRLGSLVGKVLSSNASSISVIGSILPISNLKIVLMALRWSYYFNCYYTPIITHLSKIQFRSSDNTYRGLNNNHHHNYNMVNNHQFKETIQLLVNTIQLHIHKPSLFLYLKSHQVLKILYILGAALKD